LSSRPRARCYTLETGGDSHTYQWEAKASPQPFFTSGVTDNSTSVEPGGDLTWAVRVTVGGVHQDPGGAGDGLEPLGAANLGFDLGLFQADGVTPVQLGAAPLACSSGTPGMPGAKQCRPAAGGFWSSINDGDSDNPNDPNSQVLDTMANAAFAWGIHAGEYPPAPGAQLFRLIDPLPGPCFDAGWYPDANGRSGTDLANTQPIDTTINNPDWAGKIVGFTAGYSSYEYTNCRPGVGMDWVASSVPGFGVDRPLFEGQINTAGLFPGTYVLKVIPNASTTRILHGNVVWDRLTPDYGGWSEFGVPANQATGSSITFAVLDPCTCASVVARCIFYNKSYFDGNKVAIDMAPIAGANNDDADAIDTSKTPLMPGGGRAVFANWTGYVKGINGLIYDILGVPMGKTIAASDFEFVNQGKAGTSSVVVTSAALITQANTPVTGMTRCIITFPDGSLTNCWLKVTVKTTTGLVAPDVSYWGNAVGDTGVGNTSSRILVNASDEVMCRWPYTLNALRRATVTNPSDLNKDSLVNSNDEVLCRPPYTTNAFNCVRMITR
jgi:hypothetical protein